VVGAGVGAGGAVVGAAVAVGAGAAVAPGTGAVGVGVSSGFGGLLRRSPAMNVWKIAAGYVPPATGCPLYSVSIDLNSFG
jgi:hypothetical protein